MCPPLLDGLAQRLARTEQMLLAEKTLQGIRTRAIRQRAMRIVVGGAVVYVLCEEISQSASLARKLRQLGRFSR